MKENKIQYVEECEGYFIYVINGKVICFRVGIFDLSVKADADRLLNLSANMFVSKALPDIHHGNTMVVLDALDSEKNLVSLYDMECLPDDLLRKARLLVDEYRRNHIVHVIGYVHIINGKVIVFSPETLDLTKAEDVSYLWNLSLELFVDEFYPAIYGNDTIAFVDKNSDGISYNVSEGDLGDLPEEYQIKVREVLYESVEFGSGARN